MYDNAVTSQFKGLNPRILRVFFIVGIIFCFWAGFHPECLYAQSTISSRQRRIFETEGVSEYERGAYDRARVYFERLVRAFPGEDRYWISYGSALQAGGERKRAINAFRRAVRIKGPLRYMGALYLAEAYRQEGNTTLARDLLFWLLRQPDLPRNLLQEVLLVYDLVEDSSLPGSEYEELIRQGVSNYRRKQYAAAKSNFDGAMTLRRTDEARLLYGITLLRLNRMDESQFFLRELAKDTEDKFIRETVSSFLQELEIDAQGRFWTWTTLDFTYEYIDFREFSADSFVVNPEAEIGFRIWQREDWELTARYRLDWEQLVSPGSDTLLSHRLGTKLGYFGERWQAQGHLGAELSQFADEAFLFRFISGFSIARRFVESIMSLSIYGVTNSGLSESYDYLTGPTSYAKFDWTFLLDPGLLSFWFDYVLDDVDDSVIGTTVIPLANKQVGFGFLTEFPVSGGFVLRSSHRLAQKRYDTRSAPSEHEREDIFYDGLFGIGFRGREKIFADLDFNFRVNNSKLTDGNSSDQRFKQKFLTLKLYWDINP